MKVSHPTLGQGQVVKQDDNNVTVDFNGTVKTLIIKFSKLTNEDGTPFGQQFEAPKGNRKTRFEKNLKASKRVYTDSENRRHARFMRDMEVAELNDKYLPSQVERMLNK